MGILLICLTFKYIIPLHFNQLLIRPVLPFEIKAAPDFSDS